MRTSKAEAEQLIAQMMAATCPLGKYSMSYDLAKSCARKSIENAIKEFEKLIKVYPDYEPLFYGSLQWNRAILRNLI